jgi:hypothetical protein
VDLTNIVSKIDIIKHTYLLIQIDDIGYDELDEPTYVDAVNELPEVK